MRKAYLFDLDFTVIQYSFYPGVFQKIIDFYELAFLTPDDLRRMIHRKSLEIFLEGKYLESHDWDKILEILLKQNGIRPSKTFTEFVIEDVTERGVPFSEGALETIDEIKENNGVVGILTNGFKKYQEIKITASGLDEIADFIVYIDDAKSVKPFQQFFKTAFQHSRKLNAKPELFLGDNFYFDVVGGLVNGIKKVFWFHNKGIYPTGIYKLKDLKDILEKTSSRYNHLFPRLSLDEEVYVVNRFKELLEFEI